MSWSQTGRILLVWPNQVNQLDHQLELNLINRYANRLGAQLALVTHISEVRFIAQQVGIPVFSSLQRAQRTPWQVDKHRNIDLRKNDQQLNLENLRQLIQPQPAAWLDHAWVRILSFLVSGVAVLALGIFILPSATVVLTPQVESQSMIFSGFADPSFTKIDLSAGSLPTFSREVIVEGHDSQIVSSTMIIPNQEAQGDLRFTNISDHMVNIPTGTIVTTIGIDPVRFSTSSKELIVVAPGESVILSAQATEPGTSGNLPADTLQVIEGQIRLDMNVTNPNATHGGTNASVPAPSTQDFKLLRERLESKLKQVALAELQSGLSNNDTPISSSQKIMKVIEEKFSPPIGEPGQALSLYLRLQFQIQVVSGESLRNLVTPIMDANNSTDYSPIPNTYVFSHISISTLGADGSTHWSMLAERKIQANIPMSQVIDQIKGKSVSSATNRLHESLPEVREIRISLTPKWWPLLPFLPLRIQVIRPATQ